MRLSWASVRRLVWRSFLACAVLTFGAVLWLALGGPIGIDRWLDVTQSPAPSQAIVVLGGGTDGANLPLPQGWDRLSTAAALFRDGYAPVVIFSGGGTARVPEAEVYANAAAWLGIPREVMRFEAGAQRTADHGPRLLGFSLSPTETVSVETPLLIVTSTFHSRRALRSFTRAGFTHVRVVSSYTAQRAAVPGTPAALESSTPAYRPSGKRYDDVLFRMAHRSYDVFIGLREVGALVIGG